MQRLRRLDFGNGLCLWVFPDPEASAKIARHRDQAARGGATRKAITQADMQARGETYAERRNRLRREKP